MSRSPAWDDIDDPEDIWLSDEENDMGYVCGKCGETPSFRDLKRGTCEGCRLERTERAEK